MESVGSLVIWHVIVGRCNPGLNEKRRNQRFRRSREKTSRMLSAIIAIRKDITSINVLATIIDDVTYNGQQACLRPLVVAGNGQSLMG